MTARLGNPRLGNPRLGNPRLGNPRLGNPRLGIIWMAACGISFAVQIGLTRALGSDIPAVQGAFIRFVWGVALLGPMLPKLRSAVPFSALGRLWVRALFHALAVTLWFFAITRIPLAQSTAIGYLNPVMMLVLAPLLLGETLALRRVLVVAAALIGALIVLRPGFQAISVGHMAQIGAALAFCASYMMAKHLAARLEAGVIVAMMSLMVAVLLAPLAWAVWQPVAGAQVLALGGVALAATLGHYAMTRAFASAPVAVTQPVTFLQLVWSSLMGAVFFGEAVDGFVLLGGGIIIAAISWLAWHEHQSGKAEAADADPARADLNGP